ncbi:MAG: glycosyltransferase [Candidatus Omnitrophica bacterium]|nr:glycosyltransferase [Candidatus Omnitrophota bacterium]
MNILQILPELEVGGVERGAVDLARYLAANGHKSVVISGGGRLAERLRDGGAVHYKLPVGKKSPLTIFFMIREVRRIIIKEDIRIIHARSRVPAIIGFAAAKLTNRIFITTAHGYYNTAFTSRPMSWGRFVIVASHDMAKHMMDDFGTPYDRMRLIPRGVNLDEFRFVKREEAAAENKPHKKKDFTIGIISRITPIKGHADLLRAAAILFRKTPNIKVLVVGDAPPNKPRYKEELEVLTRQMGISTIVDFMGSRSDIPEILSKLDVLVLPTRTPEAFGRVIIEAQAVGVPVVATGVGGITDIIRDGENGLLVFPEDPHSIADAVTRLLKDPELGRSLARKARREVEEKYSLQPMVEKTLKVYEEALALKKILVIKISALGDVILSVPSLKAIRKKFPKAVIKVLVGLPSSGVLKGCPHIDERIIYEPRTGESRFKCLMRFCARLIKEDFDIVVDLQNNRASHILAFMTMANLRYGYNNGKWSFLLNRRVKDTKAPITPVEHQFRTLNLMGIENAGETLELWPSEENEEWADNFLKENWIEERRILVGINIAASSRWQSKRWGADRIAALCDELARKHDIRTVLTGAPEDVEIAKEVTRLSNSKPIIAAGKTDIMQLASLIGRSKVYVTTDSAPLHIAAGMKVPIVALFGPTDPARHMPKVENSTVLRSSMKCSPCYKPFCGKQNRCMDLIRVEDVLAAVEKYLEPDSRSEKNLIYADTSAKHTS